MRVKWSEVSPAVSVVYAFFANIIIIQSLFMLCWPCSLVQSCKINPTRCSILLSILISLLYMFRAQFCLVYLFLFSTCFGQPRAYHQEKLLYLCDTGICHSVWVASGLLVGVSLQPADQTPPIQSDKCQWRIDTVISPDDGHMVARNMYRREIKILSRIVHLVGFICKNVQGCTVKKMNRTILM